MRDGWRYQVLARDDATRRDGDSEIIQEGTLMVSVPPSLRVPWQVRTYATALSVTSNALSIIAKASRISASVIDSGGFVKNVFQRTNV